MYSLLPTYTLGEIAPTAEGGWHKLQEMADPLQEPSLLEQVRLTAQPYVPGWHVHHCRGKEAETEETRAHGESRSEGEERQGGVEGEAASQALLTHVSGSARRPRRVDGIGGTWNAAGCAVATNGARRRRHRLAVAGHVWTRLLAAAPPGPVAAAA